MSVTELKPKPIRAKSQRRESYWIKVQCARTCPGHIIPFDRVVEVIILANVNIDFEQWNIAREQELQAYHDLVNPTPPEEKKTYISKNHNRKSIKIFGKLS